ncbi:MAG: hypothetical protein JWP87_65 [Labilithrix sp.]|nr:hypothetical protein [Labilithrix sp.]
MLPVVLGLAVAGSACAEPTDGAAPVRTAHDVARSSELDLETVGCSTTPPLRRAPPEFDDADPSAVRLFYDVLAPYGSWTEDVRLGLVWMPARAGVGEAFVPYATHGRWTHRAFDSGESAPIDEYVWVSDLPWGWVTFHYGRWTFAGERGWAWIPGRRYAGAWVDWRAPERGDDPSAVVGWGPTPPSQLWRVSPGPSPSRARGHGQIDVREARLVAVPYAAFATPYAYVRARELFATDIGERLLHGPAALAVAHGTQPSSAPRPPRLGFRAGDVPSPPTLDRGLQQAWMLATPATASAVGAGPELGAPPRLRTYVTGGPHFATLRN